jgi:hypothetical protein
MPTHPSSLYLGSISIELNQFTARPSLVSNNKAQGKKHVTSPSKIRFYLIELTNISNTFPSPAKNFITSPNPPISDQNTQHPETLDTNHETPRLLPKILKTQPKKKRHRNIGSPNPHKKGHAALSFDPMLSDDMDTSKLTETQPIQLKAFPPKTPPYFYKAVQTRKKFAHSSQKPWSIDLSPNPP